MNSAVMHQVFVYIGAEQEWYAAALLETEAHADYDDLAKNYGGPRQ